MKRSPLKRSGKPLKKAGLKKVSNKKREQIPQEQKEQEKMWDLFLSIWDKIPSEGRRCFETGRLLGPVPLSAYFHHVLPKAKYPQYKFSEWNIVLLTWATHDQAEKDLDKTPKVKQLTLELLEKHNNFELKP